MGKIYCLTGKSGTGKDTLYNALLSDSQIKITPIIPYTTRPMRNNETPGVQYNFVSEDEFHKLDTIGKVIEKRSYDTILGRWYYFTIDNDLDFNGDYLIITTPEAVTKLYKRYGQEKIVVVYLEIDDYTRLERSIQRERRQKQPNFSEVCRRYLSDESDFSEENLKKYNPLYRIITTASIKTCVQEFIKITNI